MKRLSLRLFLLLTIILPFIGIAQPINDDPCGAIELAMIDGAACTPADALNWTGATATAGFPAPGCASYTTGDVWFKFTLPTNADIFVTTLAGTGGDAITDGGMAIYYAADSCNGAFFKLLCDDDGGPSSMPQIALQAQTSGTYYVRLWDFNDKISANIGGICVATQANTGMPPLNDEPCGAIVLTPLSDTACTPDTPLAWTNATGTPGLIGPDCGSYTTGDIWFKFTLNEASDILINTAPGTDPGAITDGAMTLYSASACDASFATVACDDDNGPGSMPQIQQFAMPAGDYFIRFWDYNDKTSGNIGGICVAAVPTVSMVANDICGTALPFPVLPGDGSCASVAVNTAGATGLPQANCGGAIADDDVWYTFSPPAGVSQIAFHITMNGNPSAQGLRVYSGPCGQQLPVACFAASEGIVNNLTPGQTYYLRTYTIGQDTSAAYDICLQALIPPVNDNPCGAIALTPVDNATNCTPGNPVTWQNAGNTSSLPAPNCGSYTNGDVWFKFELTYKADIVVSSAAGTGSGAIIDGAMALYKSNGDCNDLIRLACNDDAVSNVVLMPEIGEFALSPGTYYLRFWDYYDATSGNIGGICVATVPSVSTAVNDQCIDALPFPLIPTDGTCATVQADNTGATGSLNAPGPGYPDDDIWYSFVVPMGVTSLLYEISTNSGNSQHVLCLYGACGEGSIDCFLEESGRFDNLIAGETYVLRVYTGEIGVPSNFNICLKTPPAPPANDNCAGAIHFPAIPTDGSCASVIANTEWATPSGTYTCSDSNNDVWFSFVVPDNVSDLVAQIFQHPGSTHRESYEVFAGTCDNLIPVACYYDYDNVSLRLNDLVPGQTYFLRAFSGTDVPQIFDICLSVSPPPPPNDDCAAAIPFPAIPTDGTCATVLAKTIGAGGDNSDACYSIYDDDVWYTFTMPLGFTSILVKTSPVSGADLTGAGIFSGTCDNPVQVGCQYYDDAIIYGLVGGETYLLRAYTLLANEAGVFYVCLSTPPPPPVNDECTGAIAFPAVSLDGNWVNVNGTTLAATASGLPSCNGYANDDVWYKFTVPPGQDRLLFDYGYNYSVVSELYSGDCDSLTFIECYGTSNSTGDLRGLVAGETYYLRVFSLDEMGFVNFHIRLSVPMQPANDLCDHALVFPPLPADGTCVAMSGNTALAVDWTGLIGCYGTPDDDVWFQFTVPNGYSTVIFDLEGNFGETPTLDVFKGTCDSPILQECYFYPTIEDISGLEPGTYWIRVFSSGPSGESSDFTLCLSLAPLPPANDDCVNATSITSAPGVFADPGPQTTAGATASDQEICYPFTGPTYDVWYSFVTDADGGDATVTIDFEEPALGSYAFFNFAAQGFEGECGDFTTLVCVENAFLGFGLQDTFITFNFYGLSGNTTYYFRVFALGSSGNYAPVDFTVDAVGTALSPVSGSAEVSDNSAPGIVRVYPSPAASQVTVQFEAEATGLAQLYVLDVLGRVVLQRQLDVLPGANNTTLGIQGLPAGLYTLWLDNGRGRGKPGRFVKQ